MDVELNDLLGRAPAGTDNGDVMEMLARPIPTRVMMLNPRMRPRRRLVKVSLPAVGVVIRFG